MFSLSFCCLLAGRWWWNTIVLHQSVGGNELLAMRSAFQTLPFLFQFLFTLRVSSQFSASCCLLLQIAMPSAASWLLQGTVTFEEMIFQ